MKTNKFVYILKNDYRSEILGVFSTRQKLIKNVRKRAKAYTTDGDKIIGEYHGSMNGYLAIKRALSNKETWVVKFEWHREILDQ